MGKSGKKPRNKGLDPRKFEPGAQQAAKKDKDDFNFEEFARMKTRGKRAW